MTRSLRGLFFNRVFQCVIHHLSNPKMKMLKKRMLRTSLNRQLSMLPVAVDAFEPAFRGLRGHSGHGATFRGHGATVQIKQVGLTRSLRIPYAFLTRKKTHSFFKIGFVAAMNMSQPEQIGTVEPEKPVSIGTEPFRNRTDFL